MHALGALNHDKSSISMLHWTKQRVFIEDPSDIFITGANISVRSKIMSNWCILTGLTHRVYTALGAHIKFWPMQSDFTGHFLKKLLILQRYSIQLFKQIEDL